MRYLWLTREQAEAIARHAADDAPREACGIIGGVGEKAAKIIRVANVADDPLHHYRLDGAGLVNAVRELEDAGLGIVGFYHSHPASDPIPSRTDIQQATYPNTAYVIAGFKRSEAGLAAWLLNDGEAERLPLHVGDTPPDEADIAPLSRAQKTAIIVAAVLAVAVFIVIAVTLLPPAPDITSTLP